MKRNIIWADNPDAVLKVYSGTGALKRDFTWFGIRSKQGCPEQPVEQLYESNGEGDGRKEHEKRILEGEEKQRFEGDGPKGRAMRVFDRDEFQMRLLRNNLIHQIHFQSETIDEGLDRFTGSPFGAVSLHVGSR
ncbi:hypothetical protein BY996DRAFT_6428985 [Phakopsora pachyrhizi]|nr:hypothetical protein BY996DRAFT_6428985 [Phakopsora pachyrhizi]